MSRHRTRSILARAAQGVFAGTGVYHTKEENAEGAGGAGAEEKDKGKKKGDEEPEKVTLTKAELDAKIKEASESAAKAESEKLAKERDAEKQQREADEAKKKGEWEELYKKEQTASQKREEEAKGLRLELRKTQVNGRLRDFIAEHHSDYGAAAKYISPLLTVAADTTDADADKQIKAAVEQYVKDNPRKGVINVPPSHQHKLPRGTEVPANERETVRTRPTGPASRF